MSNKLGYGKVVILGRPNTGKSTLLNSLMEQKVSITSPLPQTTRKVTRVKYQDDRGVIIFSDTPGIIGKVDDLMGKRINTEAPKEINNADVVIMMVDISRPKSDEENKILGIVRKVNCKKVLVYNKIDKAVGPKEHLPEYQYLEEEFDKVIAVSALKNKFVKGLVNLLFEILPLVDEDKVKEEVDMRFDDTKPKIGMDSKEYVEEIIREKAYLFLREEVPYSIAVEVTEIKDKRDMIVIKAIINTHTDRYKKMIIGKGGAKIKEIGYNARKELELMAQKKVFLELRVETNKHWMEKMMENV